MGCKGVYITRTCYHDATISNFSREHENALKSMELLTLLNYFWTLNVVYAVVKTDRYCMEHHLTATSKVKPNYDTRMHQCLLFLQIASI